MPTTHLLVTKCWKPVRTPTLLFKEYFLHNLIFLEMLGDLRPSNVFLPFFVRPLLFVFLRKVFLSLIFSVYLQLGTALKRVPGVVGFLYSNIIITI